jgi:O-antigen ligase
MIKYINKIGFFTLIVFFMLVPLHFWTSEKLSYFYKEAFAFVFLILTIPILNKKTSYRLGYELFFLLLFIIYLFLCSILFDSRIIYPGDGYLIELSMSQDFYVIRNALIYIPMLIYIYKRGLVKNEINFLLKTISIFGVISIAAFLIFFNITPDLGSVVKLFALGGDFLQYNSFVPYLTFPFASSVYLAFSQSKNKTKLFFSIIAFLIFSYIVISTSRQSIIFCGIVIFTFIVSDKKIFKSFLKVIIPIVVLLILILPGYLSNIEISEKLTSKTSSFEGLTSDETGRLEMATDGLYRLSFIEIFSGAGVSSVVNSGPHNDFVRWTQRLGIFGALLCFLPFLISFIGSFKLMKKTLSHYHTFVFLIIFYTIYISFFGYPREDAYQAPFVWLGLSLWLIINNHSVKAKGK